MNNTFEDVNIKDRWRKILNRTLSDIRQKNKDCKDKLVIKNAENGKNI